MQAIVNGVAFFSLHNRLEHGLLGFLHPLSLGEKLVALFFHRRILKHNGASHRTTSTHRNECDTVLVHIHADNGVCIVLAGDVMSLVCDCDMQSPLIVFVNDFVVKVGFELSKCLVNDEFGGIIDVIGVGNNSRFGVTPFPPLPIKPIGFVAEATGLETALLQIVSTPPS